MYISTQTSQKFCGFPNVVGKTSDSVFLMFSRSLNLNLKSVCLKKLSFLLYWVLSILIVCNCRPWIQAWWPPLPQKEPKPIFFPSLYFPLTHRSNLCCCELSTIDSLTGNLTKSNVWVKIPRRSARRKDPGFSSGWGQAGVWIRCSQRLPWKQTRGQMTRSFLGKVSLGGCHCSSVDLETCLLSCALPSIDAVTLQLMV